MLKLNANTTYDSYFNIHIILVATENLASKHAFGGLSLVASIPRRYNMVSTDTNTRRPTGFRHSDNNKSYYNLISIA